MKKLIVIGLAIALIASVVVTADALLLAPGAKLSSNRSTAQTVVGDVYIAKDGKVYKYVQAGSTIEQYDILIATDTDAKLYTIPAAVNANGVPVAAIANTDIDSGNYGFVQIGGVAEVTVDSGQAGIGNGATCGVATISTCQNVTANAGSDTLYMIGVWQSPASDSSVKKVRLQGLW